MPDDDIYDELDAFVDSEPLEWSSRPQKRGRPVREPQTEERAPAPATPPAREPAPIDPAPKFSRATPQTRRDAFAARLDAELTKPLRAAAPRAEPPLARADAPEPRAPLAHPPSAEPEPPVESLGAEDPVVAAADEPPADAMQMELDDAIGRIVLGAKDEAPAPAAAPDAAPATAEPDFGSLGPVGVRPQKAVPSFRFERRDDADEGVTALPDIDNPLSTAFFPEVGEEYETIANPLDPDDTLEDAFLGDDHGDVDRLPPSLAGEGRRRSSRRLVAMASAAAGLVAVGLVALVGVNVLAGNDEPDAPPPVITADARDVKVRPEATASTAEPDILERTRVRETGELVVPEDVAIAPRDATANVSPVRQSLDAELASRRVRTVSVRPDGTIVASDVEGRRTPPQAPIEVAAIEPRAEPQDVVVERPAPEPVETPAVAAPGLPVPSRKPAVPAATRSSGPVNLVASRTTEPAPAAPAASSGPWGVQLASQRSRADAEASFANLQRRYSSILGGRAPMIVAANVGARGRFYRVRVATPSRGEAAALCQRLKNAGADCFIGRN
ncbi:MAG: SPOR domain-containing protein [Pseudomonadota bacterium]